MFIKQISVFMENRPGRLAEITKLLSENNIDMRAVNIADTTDFGILRMIVDEPEKAAETLRNNEMIASVADVIAVSIPDKIGSFHQVIGLLGDNDISVEYIYSFIGEKSDKAGIIIKTDNTEKTVEVLQNGGIPILSLDDLRI